MSGKDEWLTDPQVVRSLGEFDLDPCAPADRPWATALKHLTVADNGLLHEWWGRVWLNPPYGRLVMKHWINRMNLHGDGIMLINAVTANLSFHQAMDVADSMFLFRRRLNFYERVGDQWVMRKGLAPSVLLAYGEYNSDAIDASGLDGRHVPLNRIGVLVVGFDRTWKMVISTIFIRLGREASLQELYRHVEDIAGEKVARNPNYKAKVRQTVQMHFKKVRPTVYAL